MASQYSFGKVVTKGLVLCLDAGDKNSYPGSGTTWFDLSGKRNHGTLINGPTFNSANGGGIVFDGSNDYVNLGSFSNLVGKSGVTIDSWFYNDSTAATFQSIIGQFNGSVNRGWLIHTSTNANYKIVVLVGDGNAYGGVNDTPTGAWFNVVLSYDGSLTGNFNRLKMYLNGAYRAFQSYNGGTVPSTWPDATGVNVAVGQLINYSRYFDGNISIVRAYDRTLSAAEILQNYNAQKARFGLK